MGREGSHDFLVERDACAGPLRLARRFVERIGNVSRPRRASHASLCRQCRSSRSYIGGIVDRRKIGCNISCKTGCSSRCFIVCISACRLPRCAANPRRRESERFKRGFIERHGRPPSET
jgi:hypothetical protein